MNIVVCDTTLRDFYDSPEAKKRMDSKEVITLEALMRSDPHLTLESMFLDFLRNFHSVSLIVRPDQDLATSGEIAYSQIQSAFQDLLLAKRRLEKEEFESWMNAPAYEKEDKDAAC